MTRLLPLLVLLPGAAWSMTPEVATFVKSAAGLYRSLEFDRALDQIRRAKALVRDSEDAEVVALYEGVVLADLGREDESEAAFRTALSMDPDARLPLKVSPKVEASFETLRAATRKNLAQVDLPRRAAPPPAVTAPSPVSTERPKWPWILVAAGGACGVGSAIAFAQSNAIHARLLTGSYPDGLTATGAANSGSTAQTAGGVLAAAGGAAILGGVALLLWGPRSPVTVSPAPGGAAVFARFP